MLSTKLKDQVLDSTVQCGSSLVAPRKRQLFPMPAELCFWLKLNGQVGQFREQQHIDQSHASVRRKDVQVT